MAVPLTDLIQWLGYGLYLLGAILLWVYSRDQRNLNSRVTELERSRPTHSDVNTMIEAGLYRDSTRP